MCNFSTVFLPGASLEAGVEGHSVQCEEGGGEDQSRAPSINNLQYLSYSVKSLDMVIRKENIKDNSLEI